MSEEKVLIALSDLANGALNYYKTTETVMIRKRVIEDYINRLQQENQQLKEKIKQYEDPDDLTLMFLYCSEQAKDKIKELQQENKQLKEKQPYIYTDTNWNDLLEYNNQTWVNLDRFKLLKERVEYLERSNACREETILSLREEQQLDMYKNLIDEIKFDIQFCINNMKNEYACTDKRTNRELHTMVEILEESISKIDKALGDDEK